MGDEAADPAEGGRSGASVRVLGRRVAVPIGWRADDTVRRSNKGRRWRRLLGVGLVVLLAGASVVALVSSGPSHKHGGSTRDVALAHGQRIAQRLNGAVQLVAKTTPLAPVAPGAEDDVAAADLALAVKLLQQLDSNGAKNVSVSPSSLYFALAMVQNGARGETQRQIAAALQASGIDTGRQNAGVATLTGDWAAAANSGGFTLESANSLWQQRGFTLRDRFLTDMAAYFKTGVWQTDFAHHNADTLKAIDAWTAQHTHGKITKLFDQLDPDTVLVLANAIYFHAAWATPFDPNETMPRDFTRADGSTARTKFMSGRYPLVSTSDYQAAQLMYRGNRFAAMALMPTHGSLRDFVHGLTSGDLSRIATRLEAAATGSVDLPRFTTTTKTDMRPVLQALGMRLAFTDNADFSALSPESTKVDQVIQRVYLSVAEKGTTAAAVTGVSMLPTSAYAGPSASFDHPFLFLIRDTTTGAIVFASEIQDPTEA